MSHRSVLLVISFALLACTAEPTTAAGTELVTWRNEGRLSMSGITQSDPVGEDDERRFRFSYSPTALTGLFDPTLEDLRIEVTATTGVRTMRREDGTTFTANMPISMRAVTITETHWVITPRCDDTIASPMPSVSADGTLAYADGATFWQTCTIELERGENLQYIAHLEVWGDGRVEGSSASGAVTMAGLP
jgi:hypothetical protein